MSGYFKNKRRKRRRREEREREVERREREVEEREDMRERGSEFGNVKCIVSPREREREGEIDR